MEKGCIRRQKLRRKKAVNKSGAVKGFFLARKDAGKGCAENIHEIITERKLASMIFPKTVVLFH